ncbi:MAG: glycosyltransferase [Solirubrobacteraceae bacterium]
MRPTACFVSASHQNVFFGELLDALAEALSAHGIAVERSVDCFPELREELVYLFVPHELLPRLMPDAQPSEPQLRRSVTICTEQPGTSWFEDSVRISRRAGRTVDINPLGVAALNKLGVPARLLQLGYVPAWDRWKAEQADQRPVELTFLAGVTPRRTEALARCAAQLAGRRTELHLPEAVVPHRADTVGFLSGARKWELLSRSKLLMNVHRGELGYFEWQRAIEAMANGCVLLSEHSLGFEPLVPGEHFLSASLDTLPVALEALLDDEDRLARVRRSAYAFLREELPLSSAMEVLAEAVTEAANRPANVAGALAGGAVARPKSPPLPVPEYERIERTSGDLDAPRAAAKQLPLDRREQRRTSRDVEFALDGRRRGEDGEERLGLPRDGTPRVSVLLAVRDQAVQVADAIDSLAVSDFTDYELVVVEDASSDGRGDAIRSALGRSPWIAARLISHPSRDGLAQARNLGAAAAVGELLLVLTPDHALYPHALGRLVRALDEAPAATFAYGIVEQLAPDGSAGLDSYLDWDPERLRFGSYLGAAAMIRRSELLRAGGYVSDPRLDGWEDFALWCSFADRGWDGLRVPELLARQRLPAFESTVAAGVANVDAGAAWNALLERFAFLSTSAAA